MKNTNLKELQVIVERKEGRNIVLKLTDGQELKLPIFNLPNKVSPGQNLILKVLTEHEAATERSELARYLLEEILNGDKDN